MGARVSRKELSKLLKISFTYLNKLNENTVKKGKVEFKYQSIAYKTLSL